MMNGYRRGYILVGNPGTGKTSILLRLENELRQYPIVYVSPNNISEERKINMIFSFLKVITPCIVCLEDFDSYGFDSKNGALGVFLNQIDNSKDKLNIIYVATINDSKKLNYSLVRPGRFDVVIEVREPKDNEEIYSIMKTHYTRQMSINEADTAIPFVDRKSISWFTFWRLKKHTLTQADYCEIIQKLILIWLFHNLTYRFWIIRISFSVYSGICHCYSTYIARFTSSFSKHNHT
jgi:SpoVK/Ycf46/Vps4 family AAA+-type ATPase